MLWCVPSGGMLKGLPAFYAELFTAWGELLPQLRCAPLDRTAILRQPLFRNPAVREGGRMLQYNDWMQAGVIQFRDLPAILCGVRCVAGGRRGCAVGQRAAEA